jgi:hypothetical protein
MAGGVVAPVAGARASQYHSKLTFQAFIICVVAASGGLLFGKPFSQFPYVMLTLHPSALYRVTGKIKPRDIRAVFLFFFGVKVSPAAGLLSDGPRLRGVAVVVTIIHDIGH